LLWRSALGLRLTAEWSRSKVETPSRASGGESATDETKETSNSTNMNTELNTMSRLECHHPGLGLSNVWTPDSGRTWSWANRCGEGCGESSFDAAVDAAEAALEAAKAEQEVEASNE
jgi:hypothetical protein